MHASDDAIASRVKSGRSVKFTVLPNHRRDCNPAVLPYVLPFEFGSMVPNSKGNTLKKDHNA